MAMTATKSVGSSELLFSPNHGEGAAGRNLRDEGRQRLEASFKSSVFWHLAILGGRARSKVADLGRLQSNWDSYGAPAPNAIALETAIRVLELMQPSDLLVATIVPSAEGGIGFCFSAGDRYADIECSNDGSFLSVRYVGKETPRLIEIDGTDRSIMAALEEIRNHICE